MQQRKRAWIAIIALALGAGATVCVQYSHRYDLRHARTGLPWFAKRYSGDIPLFMTPDNAADTLAKIEDSAQREAVSKALTRLKPAETEHPHPISCAVVGNSGNLAGSGYGSQIDGHSYVFRMNDAPLEGYIRDVGNRTTYHVLHLLHDSINVYERDTVTIIMAGEHNADYQNAQQEDRYKHFLSDVLRSMARQLYPDQFRAMNPQEVPYFPHNVKNLPGGMVLINPEFTRYVYDNWFKKGAHSSYDYPSTGFRTLILAFHLCDSVDLFGFGARLNGNWDHYFDLDRNDPSPRHEPSYQEEFLDELEKKHIIRIFKGNFARKTDLHTP